MLEHRFPRQPLQQANQPFFLISKLGLFQNGWHRQADGTAAVDHGEISVGHQSHERWFTVAERPFREEIFLFLQARSLTRDDLLGQGDHCLAPRQCTTRSARIAC